jgi:SAM-dependent methyltransferase
MGLEDSINKLAMKMELYSKSLDTESANYWQFHHKRFTYITRETGNLISELERSGCNVERILDVGNSFQTLMISQLRPDLEIDTLGYLAERYRPVGITKHYNFDVNDAYYPDRWIVLGKDSRYDIILFLEVIEHLYTAPEQVLSFLGSLLKPDGLIVIQTPNAASLINRLRLLFGENPYELIRSDRMNPGHFREYTKLEITKLANQSGFVVEELFMMDYFPTFTLAEKICQLAAKILPATFRTGMTVILKRIN